MKIKYLAEISIILLSRDDEEINNVLIRSANAGILDTNKDNRIAALKISQAFVDTWTSCAEAVKIASMGMLDTDSDVRSRASEVLNGATKFINNVKENSNHNIRIQILELLKVLVKDRKSLDVAKEIMGKAINDEDNSVRRKAEELRTIIESFNF